MARVLDAGVFVGGDEVERVRGRARDLLRRRLRGRRQLGDGRARARPARARRRRRATRSSRSRTRVCRPWPRSSRAARRRCSSTSTRVTMTLDPARFEDACGPRTRAIVPVHLYGRLADMDAILRSPRDRGLLVVEDVAQAIGARRSGRTRRHVRRRGRLQLLPDEEPRRARRRRRRRHERPLRSPSACGACAPTAARAYDRRARPEQPARSAAGGGPAREAAVPRARGTRADASWRSGTTERLAGAPGDAARPRPRTASTSGTCTSCVHEQRESLRERASPGAA